MNILLVDDHALFRAGLSMVLGAIEGVNQIVEKESGADAMAHLSSGETVDLVLLDYQLEDVDGLEVLAQLLQDYSQLPVIMLSAHENSELIQAALSAGAKGFITKSSTSDVMASAIKLVASGGLYVPPEILASNNQSKPTPKFANNGQGSGPSATNVNGDAPKLTDRQLDVMAQMGLGLSNKEIARELNMSPSTVKVHVAAILKEFEVKNRTQAVSMAREIGMI